MADDVALDAATASYLDRYESLHHEVVDSVDQRYREDEYVINCFRQNAAEIGFSRAQSFLSVGPGTGILDKEVLESSCPHVRRYIAVDQSESLLRLVKEEMSHLPNNNLEVEVVQSSLQNYNGPSEPVDVIFLSHILYYVHSYGRECKRMYEWLAPGGSMVIVVNRGDGRECANLYTEMALAVSGQVPQSLSVNSETVKHWLIKNGIPHTQEYRVRSELLIHPGPSLKELVHFILMGQEPTQEMMEKCLQIMKKYCKPGTDVCEEEIVIMVVKKPHS